MVKVDPKHNYYADLELPSSCSIDDIKKQYRRLALLYHPDRNAGKEEEYVPKFQAIQTAHEVLGDASTKQKYDADRRKTGGQSSSRAGQPTGNPYTANSAYPPPPRRTQPGTWQRPPSYASGGPQSGAQSSGADRFSNFPRGAPTSRKDPVQDRTNMFKAWQNMNSAQDRQSRSNTPSNGHSNGTSGRPRPPPPPRPDSARPTEEEIRAGMNHRKAPPGYDTDGAEARQSAWSAFNQANSGRPGMGHAPSYRTPKKGGFDPNAPGSDERPATGQGYVHHRKSMDMGQSPHPAYPPPPPGPPPRSPMSPATPSEARPPPTADPLRHFKARLSSDDIPVADAYERPRSPYTNFSGEKTDVFSEGLRRSASTRDATRLKNEPKVNRARSSSPVRKETDPTGPQNGFGPFGSADSSEVESSSEDEGSVPKTATAPAARPKKIPKRPSIRLNGSSFETKSAPGAPSDARQKSGSNIFSAPYSDGGFAPSFANPSKTYDIDTQFSPEGWSGTFTAAEPQSDESAAAPVRASNLERGDNASQPNQIPARGPTGPQFSQDEWQKTFKDASWTWDGPSRDSSPNKGAAKVKGVNRRPVAAKVPVARSEQSGPTSNDGHSADQPHVISDDEPTVTQQNSRAPAGAETGDAMDIDSAPSTPQKDSQVPSPAREPRIYAVPPSTWRQQQVNRLQEESAKSSNPLDDLRHVEPLAPSSEGMLNLNDIGATLPFESQASSTLSSQTTNPQKFRLPPMPKAPEPPARLTQQSWHGHAQAFGAYVQAYHMFNETLLQHFVTRQAQAQARFNMGTGWLEAAGETSGLTGEQLGFGTYLKGIREDAPVREAWTLGCERHAEAVEGFERLRERVKRSVANGTLPTH